eukprot:13339370-Alexandrium_andersonii.AAC.1
MGAGQVIPAVLKQAVGQGLLGHREGLLGTRKPKAEASDSGRDGARGPNPVGPSRKGSGAQ